MWPDSECSAASDVEVEGETARELEGRPMAKRTYEVVRLRPEARLEDLPEYASNLVGVEMRRVTTTYDSRSKLVEIVEATLDTGPLYLPMLSEWLENSSLSKAEGATQLQQDRGRREVFLSGLSRSGLLASPQER